MGVAHRISLASTPGTTVHRVTKDRGDLRAVVFDMGGVLVELGPLTEILGEERLPPEVFWERWLRSPAVRDFERGWCDAEEFGDRLVAELGLSFDGTEMVRRFAAWPKGLFDGAESLVADLPDDLEIGVLSNTNALHWHEQHQHERVRALFTRTFLSYELGIVKPDAEIFAHVIGDLRCDPRQIVYFDDNQINVDAALAAGIDAALARGPADCRRELLARGVLE